MSRDEQLKTLKRRLTEQVQQRQGAGTRGTAPRLEGDDLAVLSAWLKDRPLAIIQLRFGTAGGVASVLYGIGEQQVELPVSAPLSLEPQHGLWDALLMAIALYEDKNDPDPSFHGSGGVD